MVAAQQDPNLDVMRKNLMLIANLVGQMSFGPLLTSIKPIITMESGFIDFVPETSENLKKLKNDVNEVYNDYFNRLKKKISFATLAYQLKNTNDGGVHGTVSSLVNSMTEFLNSRELSVAKNSNILTNELNTQLKKLTQVMNAVNASYDAANKLSQSEQAAVMPAQASRNVSNLIKVAGTIQRKYKL